MRREDTNVAKHVTTMKVGRKRPRRRPRLRSMDRVRSDVEKTSSIQSLHRTEKHGERQSWRSTPDRDKIGSGEVSNGEHNVWEANIYLVN